MEKQFKIVNVEFHALESMFLKTLEKYDRIKEKKVRHMKLYNKKDAAFELNMSFNTLQRKIKAGLINTTSDGTQIPQSSIDNYLRQNK
ncbi:helix-turn-helix domain-containing protein [Carboxylicivirga marina]|uniref:DNA-binding protein n=1 Tax=Carboxylicivirga marina TaxID=2800988 RepID=A0ABS1HM83_9BACT|nr:helix-turn-helix domain-containing protein [Carboxylicivirga marina]MBK3518720.1 hypothetical protein [Carboxylicivirga marina]